MTIVVYMKQTNLKSKPVPKDKKVVRKFTGSHAVMEALIDQGVDLIFGYPGGAIMPVYDALYDYKDKIRHILVRHEQGASHAAEGYARITGKPGVCLVTSGPGATNLVTGITDAMMDSIPIVCITGQVASNLVGTDAFQEADVMGITTPITKWNYQITRASEIPEVIAKAFKIAGTGRPGPVLIDITKNAQVEEIDYKGVADIEIPGYQPTITPHASQIQKAAEIINRAQKPYLLVGHGVLISKAWNEVKKLAETGGIPTAATLHGLSAIETSHPLYVGMLGMHGNYGTNRLTNVADVIIAVGMRFDDRVTGRVSDYAKQAKIIHIDIDPAEISKIVATTVPIVADAKLAVTELAKRVKPTQHDAWLAEFKKLYQEEYDKVIKHEMYPQDGQITMAEVINKLSEKTKGEAAIIADVGQHQMVAARYYQFKQPNSYISSGGLGTMGFALPAAMGAKLGAPDREVIAIIGDGSFQMTIQELGTIAQEELPVKIIILNNNFLGMVRQWQQLFFENRYSFVELKNPDFVAVSKGFGIDGQEVADRKELDQALDTLLASNKPYLLNIIVKKEENVFPMVPSGASVAEIRLE